MKKKNMRKFSILLPVFLILFLAAGCGSTQSITDTASSNVDKTETSMEEVTRDPETNLDTGNSTPAYNADAEKGSEEDTSTLQIQVEADGYTIVFELNDSPAAKSLCDQLPLTIEVQNYSNDEKIFYPPEELDVSDTPMADAAAGTLAYFAPWGDVVMYYDDFGSYSGLYELGTAVSGMENIEAISGEITIRRVE